MHQHILRIFILGVIKISKSLTSHPFLMLKIKFWFIEVASFVVWFKQKMITQTLRPEETLKSDNFVPVKSVLPHKFICEKHIFL